MRSCSGANPATPCRESKKSGGAGEHPQQALVAARGVGDLPDAVERLVARVLAHAQDRLGLVDDNY